MTTPTREEEYELREACWAIVKDGRGMNETGHGAAVRWARAVLGLDESRYEPHKSSDQSNPSAPITYESWPDGINPYVTPERRAELLRERAFREAGIVVR